jgi:uncharacterized protein (TIGR02996 family)
VNAAACEEAGLLADVVANPGSDALKLIYADWCEDNGREERAAVVRCRHPIGAQHFWAWFSTPSVCRRFTGAPSCGTYLATADSTDQWAIRINGGDWEFGIRLGFPERVRLPLADWLAHGKALVKEFPLVRVELSDRWPVDGRPDPRTHYWAEALEADAHLTHRHHLHRHHLPRRLYRLLAGYDGRHGLGDFMSTYRSRDAAVDALSDALLKFACT